MSERIVFSIRKFSWSEDRKSFDADRPANNRDGLQSVHRFAAKRTSAFDHAFRVSLLLRLHSDLKSMLVAYVGAQKVVAEEVERKFLVPWRLQIHEPCLSFVAVLDHLNLALTIPCEIDGGRCVANVLTVNPDQCTSRTGIDGQTPMHATRQ